MSGMKQEQAEAALPTGAVQQAGFPADQQCSGLSRHLLPARGCPAAPGSLTSLQRFPQTRTEAAELCFARIIGFTQSLSSFPRGTVRTSWRTAGKPCHGSCLLINQRVGEVRQGKKLDKCLNELFYTNNLLS